VQRPRRFEDVSVRGGELAVWQHGNIDRADAVLLLLHDLVANSRVWDLVMDRLPRNVAAVAPDLRGRGASSRLPGPWGISAHLADVSSVLDHFGVHEVGVVGQGFGAVLGLELAAANQEQVAAVVTIEQASTSEADPAESVLAELSESFDDLAQMHSQWKLSQLEHGQLEHGQLEHRAETNHAWPESVVSYLNHGAHNAPRPTSRANPDAVRADIVDCSASVPTPQNSAIVRRILVESGSAAAPSGQAGSSIFLPGHSLMSAVLTQGGADAVAGVVRSILSSQG